MIEAIPTPFTHFLTISFIMVLSGLMISIFGQFINDGMKIGGVVILIGGFLVLVINISTGLDYASQIKDQLLTLDCEQYEEAYELYEKEFIKTEYQERCIDDKEWWE